MLFGPPPLLRSSLLLTGAGPSNGGLAFTGPLDTYTANLDAAWSVSRRLLASYTGSLIRVRRSSDNMEQDIGYTTDGSLDTTALLAFTGAGNGFVCKIYAQTGTKDFQQTTASVQPRIVNAGSLCVVGTNNRPCCEVITDNIQCMTTAAFTSVPGTSITLAAFMRLITTATNARLLGTCATGSTDASATDGWLPAYITSPGLVSYDGMNRASLTLSLPKNQAYASTSISTGHTLRTSSTSNTSTFTPTSNAFQHYLLWCYTNASVAQCQAGSKFGESAVWTANRDADMTTYLTALETYYGV